MAGPASGYALGVDIGTSNTVAVLRWPDGRTRPLLFDGQPVMPSAVFLDDASRLHVGRDAQRLGQADPARYEPNPKRRVDEPGVLLGGLEVPTADLLAAVLGAVARTAVDAVGFLPPAVVTYPAAWGARRRDVLVAAIARAGWPPVGGDTGTRMVPEPVAAARYFAEVLRRPVPVGACIAVFDFGGGTLDVAVVRNEGAGFAVIGSGGVAELGGLDLDAVLVDHLGRTLSGTHQQAWQQLAQPATAAQWRNRRQFWDDVRGAKEMLSRTSAAPVPVPGVEQAVHLTREELERLAHPLLRRGVFAAAAVIGNSGLAPSQLAGLFLVGGSSRVPLVARLLHAELGIAPTVLEQPELPVAEGALSEIRAVAMAGAGSVSAPPPPAAAEPFETTVPLSPQSPPAAPAPPITPRRRPVLWIAAAAVVALAAVVTAAALYLTGGGYDDIDFQASVTELGRVKGGEDYTSNVYTGFVGDHAYYAYERKDLRLEIVAVDPPSLKERWRKQTKTTADRWAGITVLPDAVIAYADPTTSEAIKDMIVLDPETGDEMWKRPYKTEDRLYFVGDIVVFDDSAQSRLLGLDIETGKVRWEKPNPRTGGGDAGTTVYQVQTVEDVSGPSDVRGTPFAQRLDDDKRIVQIAADRSARVIDATNGNVLKSRNNVADLDDQVMAYNGWLVVASDDAGGYRLSGYDLDSLGDPKSLYTAPDPDRDLDLLAMCGELRLCLLDSGGSGAESTNVVAVDLDKGGQLWRKPAPKAEILIHFGDQVAVRSVSGEYRSRILDPSGNELLSREGAVARIDGGNLLFLDSSTESVGDYGVAGLHAGAKEPDEMGNLNDVRSSGCKWNAKYIVCPGEYDFMIGQFAK
ncbi:Hsp70 family protein [Phytohabitans rumicis]|uniref:Pyrrolo-quinoline quinone repeat domain-containing protein n=1 Tax=Phytohabitans rumicis TaxID=1076125 RepID=A0A6V8L8J7_9ACTN|nr:Hsp70 family protein [Phytohabitans rumicis]GFJ90929.1 hypothetical protein Prum_045710 [Phytohabitans rumicis]